MDFRLHILGTASALPTCSRYPSAHVLSVRGRLFLIDCGEGVQIQLRRCGISILKIDTILISHIHGDHVFGLPGLITTMGMLGRTSPLHIYAPKAVSSVVRFVQSFFGEGIKYDIVLHEVKVSSPQVVFSTKSTEVLAFPLRHRVETYGYLIREKQQMLNVIKEKIAEHSLTLKEIASLKRGQDVVRGDKLLRVQDLTFRRFAPRSYAYCSDTAPFPELADWVRGVSLLFHESTYCSDNAPLAIKTGHSTAADAARCALEAGAGTLILGHLSSRYRDYSGFLREAEEIFPDSRLPKEGDIFDVPLLYM